MTISAPPDAEKVISAYLRDDEDIAEIVGRRVVTKTPDKKGGGTDTPWVRYTALDAPLHHAGRHLEVYMQFDCYAGAAGGFPEAKELNLAVASALNDLNQANYADDDGVVITGAAVNLGAHQPDTDFEPARSRFIVTATLWLHA